MVKQSVAELCSGKFVPQPQVEIDECALFLGCHVAGAVEIDRSQASVWRLGRVA